MTTIAITIFVLGYILITLEHRSKLNKSITAAAVGALLWILIGLHEESHAVESAIHAISAETFALVVFLLSAMTLVEILLHYRFFDLLRAHLFRLGLKDSGQLWLMAGLAFVLSAIIDNLTTTIVMVQIARRFFGGKNLLLVVGAIVVSANAGGAFSPIGDVTTIMIWLAGKFTAGEIVAWGFLPSLAIALTSTWCIARKVRRDTKDEKPTRAESLALSRSEWVVISSAFISFTFPLIAHLIGLPPFMGLLFGVGLVGGIIGLFANGRGKKDTHLSMDIQHLMSRVDMASLLFFIGILFAVGALGHLGILDAISHTVFGEHANLTRLVSGSVFLGIFSAIVDNIPLTAAALDILNTTDSGIWALLALSVGTGGSLLVIGSAAGVVAMGMVKELTFKAYAQLITLPATLGYGAGILVWYIQYALFG